MGMFLGIDASASGLTAEKLRMDVISNNIANANTTAYHRRYVIFTPRETQSGGFEKMLKNAAKNRLDKNIGEGVRAVAIAEDDTPGPLVYAPGHPEANAQGYIEKPNVNIVNEMVDMITAHRAYEANTTAINAAKTMYLKALEIGR